MIKADWKKLIMANYAVDPKVVEKYLPFQTTFDQWQGNCYMSLVGFMFMNTRVLGIQFPFHTHFEEVNLRFYVVHPLKDGQKRGVVFIKEIVPLHGVTFVANSVYREHYETLPMKHTWQITPEELMIVYKWKKNEWYSLKIISESSPLEIMDGSEELFFTDQHWGYTQVNDQKTLVYEVAHPRWTYYKTKNYSIDVDFGHLYGKEFSFLSTQKPDSVFLAEGSEISLRKSAIIQHGAWSMEHGES